MKNKIQKINKSSANALSDKISELRRILPGIFSENKINWERLETTLGKEIDNRPEKYGLSWAGKSDAFRAIRIPATGTLVPQEKESKDPDKTQNIFIEGDNLEALKLLQKHYREKIKMIYIDPPYNTGKDFIYKDNFTEGLSDYYERTGQAKDGVKLTSNLESNGRYHSDWLTMMYPRLFMARNLLREDGVIFISIDDNEVHNLRMIMDEIFGEENFVAQIVVQLNPRGRTLDRYLAKTHEYILVYVKNIETEAINEIIKSEEMIAEYSRGDNSGKYRLLELRNRNPVFNRKNRPNLYYPIYANPLTGEISLDKDRKYSVEIFPLNTKKEEGCWTWGSKKVKENINILLAKKVSTGSWRVYRKDYLHSGDGNIATTKAKALWVESEINNERGKELVRGLFSGESPFDFPKSVELIKKSINIGTKRGDIILDFFAGSGTTAHAVMDLNAEDGGNRKWISVQIPEEVDEKSEAKKAGFNTIAEIARERIRRAATTVIAKKERSHASGRSAEGGQSRGIKKDEIAALPPIARNDKSDLGFKSFKLSKSNYRQWNVITDKDDEKKLKAQMKLFIEKPLVDDYDEKSVVYEILTKEGFDLSATVSHSVIPAKAGIQKLEIWTIADGERKAVISFAKKLTKDQVDSLGLSENDSFVCLDSALDDTTKVNLIRNYNIKVI